MDYVFETVTWHDLEALLASLGATFGEVRRTMNGPIFDATFRDEAFEIRPRIKGLPESRPVRDWELPAVQLLSAPATLLAVLPEAFTVRPPLQVETRSHSARVTTLLRVRATPSRELRALLEAWLDVVRALGEARFDVLRAR